MGRDLVVIGGGIVGAAAAWHATRRGADVLLIDARAPGRATDAGAGIVSPETDLRDRTPTHMLSAAARVFYPEMISALEAAGFSDTGYARCGKLVVARNDEQAGWIAPYLGALRDPERAAAPADAASLREISPAEARRLFPPLGEVTGAFVSDGGARVDGRRLVRALLAAATDNGLDIEVATVASLADVPDARAVVVAGGAWSPALLPELDIVPQRGQILHLAIDDASCERWPVVSPLAHNYLLAFDGRVVCGATREDAAGFAAEITAAGQAEVLNDALAVAPGLARARVLEWRVGLRPVARRGWPYLGAVSDRPGVFVASGHGASGLTYGPWSAAAVVDAALGVALHPDLRAFAP